MNAITWQLLLVLLAAALLGLLVGISALRLHQDRKRKEAYNSDKGVVDQLKAEHKALADEKLNMGLALEKEQKSARLAREKCNQLTAQHETLKVHASLQDQRLEKLTTELHMSEEKCIRLQRDFASFKANKLREVRMLKVSSDEWLDNEELPVLNKKVDEIAALDSVALHSAALNASVESVASDADIFNADLDRTQPIIASELDIPSLSESELPDSVEELEFELAEQDEPR